LFSGSLNQDIGGFEAQFLIEFLAKEIGYLVQELEKPVR